MISRPSGKYGLYWFESVFFGVYPRLIFLCVPNLPWRDLVTNESKVRRKRSK